MPTEDKIIISIDAKEAIKDTGALLRKVQAAYGGIAKLIAVTSNAKTGIDQYTVEVTKATTAIGKMAVAQDTLNKSLGRGAEVARIAMKKGSGTKAARVSSTLQRKLSAGAGAGMIDPTALAPVAFGWDVADRISKRGIKTLTKRGGGKAGQRISRRISDPAELLGSTGGVQSIAAAISDELATGKTSKPQRWGMAGRNPNSMLKVGIPGMSDRGNVSRVGVNPFDSKLKIASDAFSKNMFATSKGFQSLKKSIFLTQMGMLGVAFSSQALVGSFQNLLMSTLTGLVDTESAVQNAVLSQVFGSDVMGTAGVGTEQLVESSLKAKGTLADLQTILVSIGATVLGDPETVKVIKDSLTELIQKLTEPKFLQAIISIVQSVAEMLPTLANVLPPLANLIKMLGDSGLLPVIVLVIAACQILMPVLAGVQLALTGVEFIFGGLTAVAAALGISVGALIAIIAAVIIVIDFLWNLFTHLAETGDILGSIFYAFGKTLEDIWSVLSPIIDAIGGVLGFDNASEGIATTVTNFIFNKPTSADEAASYDKAVRSSRNTAL